MKILKPKEVAAILNIKERKVLELVREGRIPAIRMGRQVRIIEDDLQEFVVSLREEGIINGQDK
jgi:excisionase family DNA binding protein